jgi:hypothetical protein
VVVDHGGVDSVLAWHGYNLPASMMR